MTVEQFSIRCKESALRDIRQHVIADLSVEHGGVLVGHHEGSMIDVLAAIPAHSATSDATSLTFTSDAWAEMEAVRLAEHPDTLVVGWYHSHPGFGIFLSRHDLYIHENFFSEQYHVAYVVDPVDDSDGFFGWAGPTVTRSTSWQQLSDTGEWTRREARSAPVGQPIRRVARDVQAFAAGSDARPVQQSELRSAVPTWALGVVAAVALLVGFLLGAVLTGGGGETPSPPGLAKEAAVIADSAATTLQDLAADQSPEGVAALDRALDAAEAALEFARAAAESDPSDADAADATRAANDLENVIVDLGGGR